MQISMILPLLIWKGRSRTKVIETILARKNLFVYKGIFKDIRIDPKINLKIGLKP